MTLTTTQSVHFSASAAFTCEQGHCHVTPVWNERCKYRSQCKAIGVLTRNSFVPGGNPPVHPSSPTYLSLPSPMTSGSLPALHFCLKPCPLPTTPRQNLLPLPLTWSPPNPVCLQSGICDLSFAVYGRSLWGLFSLPMSRSCPGEITCRATVPCTPFPTTPSSSTPPLP